MPRLYLLDGMALLYRAHFALIRKPIMTSDGVNTSALFGFANTLLDITLKHEPTHLAVALDTSAPTPRHTVFPAYKAQRESMPEDLVQAIPQIKRLCAAMRIPVLAMDGYEADDIIGTLAKQAEEAGFETWMVTPDKDFGQLVSDRIKIHKPGRGGDEAEVLGVAEVLARWGVERIDQVIDVQGLMGDTVDNVPGIPGVGEKTATDLIQRFGSVENVIAQVDQLKGKLQERVRENAALALLSKQLVTIITDVPVTVPLEDLACQEYDAEALKALMVEFEFNGLGRRLFGNEFKAGRGRMLNNAAQEATDAGGDDAALTSAPIAPVVLRKLADTPHDYRLISTAAQRAALIQDILGLEKYCFDLETTSLDPREAKIVGIAFSWAAHTGFFVRLPTDAAAYAAILAEFGGVFDSAAEKVGHNLKFDLAVLHHHGVTVAGPWFDTMLVHSLLEPDQRHGMDYLSETYLAYTPVPFDAVVQIPTLPADDLFAGMSSGPSNMAEVQSDVLTDYAAEDADVTWQLAEAFRPLLDQRGQADVYYDIEAPLLPVLVRLEAHGVKIDVQALNEFGVQLEKIAIDLQAKIQAHVDAPFNVDSPKQLGEVLFDRLKLSGKPKKTSTGRYQTNEQVLQGLQGTHPIIDEILAYREVTKLKSTYVDALPEAVSKQSGKIHTTLHQLLTATGRIASSNPNLQNIPVRSEQGREIRKAFVPSESGWVLMSADYSQIELRVMAALSGDVALSEAFAQGHDIHQATAAKVYGVPIDAVLPEMRRTAKMVNFGIIYGISAFGLSQRLSIPRTEAAKIISSYFAQFPGIKTYLDETVATAKAKGYVETHTGRRRYLRDINSSNGTVRAGAERIAMNTPIQGTAADMIKLAMIRVDAALRATQLQARMLLQVHDELVFECPESEVPTLRELVIQGMTKALKLAVPIEVETGTGGNWLAAH
jgi:DNA polymerase I